MTACGYGDKSCEKNSCAEQGKAHFSESCAYSRNEGIGGKRYRKSQRFTGGYAFGIVGICGCSVKKKRCGVVFFYVSAFQNVLEKVLEKIEESQHKQEQKGNYPAKIFGDSDSDYFCKRHGAGKKKRADKADYQRGAERYFYSCAAYSDCGGKSVGTYRNYQKQYFHCKSHPLDFGVRFAPSY